MRREFAGAALCCALTVWACSDYTLVTPGNDAGATGGGGVGGGAAGHGATAGTGGAAGGGIAGSGGTGGMGGAAPTCADGVANGDETDIDCGGPSCAPCGNTKNCLAPTDCASGACPSGSCGVWSRSFGSDTDAETAWGVAIDHQGNIVVVGRFGGSVDFGDGAPVVASGDFDLYIVKYSPLGQLLWKKTCGNGYNTLADGVLVMPNDDIVIAGGCDEFLGACDVPIDLDPDPNQATPADNAFVARYSSSGDFVWARGFTTIGVATNVALDPDGSIYVAGQFDYDIDFGQGPIASNGARDIFVARLAEDDGQITWAKAFGGLNMDLTGGLATTANGDIVVSGVYYADVADPATGYIDFGGGALLRPNGWDIFLARLDGDSGTEVWAHGFGGGFNDISGGLTVDSAGNVLLSGTINLPGNLGGPNNSATGLVPFVAKYDGTGAYQWAAVGQESTYQQSSAQSVALDSADNPVTVGFFKSDPLTFGGVALSNATPNGDAADMFLVKHGSDGSNLFGARFGSGGQDALTAVAVHPATGNIVTVGTFQSTIDMGDGARQSHGFDDVIVVSFGPRP